MEGGEKVSTMRVTSARKKGVGEEGGSVFIVIGLLLQRCSDGLKLGVHWRRGS